MLPIENWKGGFSLESLAIALLSAGATELPSGRVFGLDAQTLFGILIQLFNACLLAAALSYLLYKPVRNFLRTRAEKISARIASAEDDMAKAMGLKAQYEERLKSVEQEKLDILESARKLAAEQSRELLQNAKQEAEAIKARASAEIEKEQEIIRDSLRLYIIEVSSNMAEKLVSGVVDKKAQDLLFAETLKDMEEVAWPN